MIKDIYDVIYLSDEELGIPFSKGKKERPCIIISIDYEGPLNYVLPLTSQAKYWEEDGKYFLSSLGSYVDTKCKPINISYKQILYAELSDDLILDYEDISFIKFNF